MLRYKNSVIAILFAIVVVGVGSVLYTRVNAQDTPIVGPSNQRGGVGGSQTSTDYWTTANGTLRNGTGFPVDFGGLLVHNVNDPVNGKDLLNKQYSDQALSAINNRIVALETNLSQSPTITNLSPLAVLRGGTVTITGTNLASANLVTFTGGATTVPTVVNPTTLTVIVPTGANSGTITVRVASGATAVSTQSLSIYSPIVVTSVTPSAGTTGTSVTLGGTGFLGAQTLTFPGSIIQPTFTIVSDTQITTTVPNGSGSVGNITVSRTNPSTSGSIPFTLAASSGSYTVFYGDQFSCKHAALTTQPAIVYTQENYFGPNTYSKYICNDGPRATGSTWYWLAPGVGCTTYSSQITAPVYMCGSPIFVSGPGQ